MALFKVTTSDMGPDTSEMVVDADGTLAYFGDRIADGGPIPVQIHMTLSGTTVAALLNPAHLVSVRELTSSERAYEVTRPAASR